MRRMIQMLAKLITDEFLAAINADQFELITNMINNSMKIIDDARTLIGDDELMNLIIDPIAIMITNLIAIMTDDDQLATDQAAIDRINEMICDSIID